MPMLLYGNTKNNCDAYLSILMKITKKLRKELGNSVFNFEQFPNEKPLDF